MDYHKHRFQDNSLMIFKNTQVVAVLPANKLDNTIFSHQGLTYGGLVYSEKLKMGQVLDLYKSILKYLSEKGIGKVVIKELPYIYQKFPNDDFKYIAFILKAKLLKRDALSVIDYSSAFKIASNRKEGLKMFICNNISSKELELSLIDQKNS